MSVDYVKLAEQAGTLLAAAGQKVYTTAIVGIRTEAVVEVVIQAVCVVGSYKLLRKWMDCCKKDDIYVPLVAVSGICLTVAVAVLVIEAHNNIMAMAMPEWVLLKQAIRAIRP